MSKITALYCVTPDTRFRTMAAVSIYSLLQHNPGIPIRVVEADGGDYPLGVKRHAMSDPVDTEWTLFIDADTRINADVNLLIPDDPYVQFCGRHESMYTRGSIEHENWASVCTQAGVPEVPVFNSGVWLLKGSQTVEVGAAWGHYIDWLPKNVADPLCHSQAKSRHLWWMLEQCALSLAVAKLARVNWGKREHGYRWAGEGKGIIHHYGSKRWSCFL